MLKVILFYAFHIWIRLSKCYLKKIMSHSLLITAKSITGTIFITIELEKNSKQYLTVKK